MTPFEERAVKTCAAYMGETRGDYNPVASLIDAKALADKLGLTFKDNASSLFKSGALEVVVFRGDEVIGRYSNFTHAQALTYAAMKILEKPE